MTVKIGQERAKKLVKDFIEGDGDAFGELERLARPLMIHLADYYSSLHYKFEYDDFYSICLNALYEACVKYNYDNPSFLSFAKMCMINQCNGELEYWNQEMRNIFKKKEIMVGLEREIDTYENRLLILVTTEDRAMRNEVVQNINSIIDSLFDNEKADIMRLYLFNDMRPKDISDIKELEYHNVYTTIRRGKKRIAKEYEIRYTLDFIE